MLQLASGYHFEPSFIFHHLGELGVGLSRTVEISAIGMVGAVVVGGIAGAALMLDLPVAKYVARAYVEIFRNTPLLVQIFFLYFALPRVGITLGGFTVGWLSLLLWGGAYNTENFRAGFEAVEAGHVEAARALGFNKWRTFASVIVPVGIRISLPSVTNILISVFKNSSYMIAISYPELTTTAVNIVAVTFRVFEMFLAIGVIYLGCVWLMSFGMRALERRLDVSGGA